VFFSVSRLGGIAMYETSTDENVLNNKIKQILGKGSKRQQMVAAYFLAHFEKAVFMTITQLAEAIGISTATIVRFANILGYKSYSFLQKDLHKQVKQILRPPLRLSKKVSIGDNIHARLGQYCKQHIENI
jgi:DNA-binding MurR/RpiR family transcriptional regulator